MHNSQVQDFTEAVSRGAKFIVVDPGFSTAAGKAEHWLPIRLVPICLVLAWTNLVIQNNWYDKAYIDRYAIGF